jgi:hypothetical protein
MYRTEKAAPDEQAGDRQPSAVAEPDTREALISQKEGKRRRDDKGSRDGRNDDTQPRQVADWLVLVIVRNALQSSRGKQANRETAESVLLDAER